MAKWETPYLRCFHTDSISTLGCLFVSLLSYQMVHSRCSYNSTQKSRSERPYRSKDSWTLFIVLALSPFEDVCIYEWIHVCTCVFLKGQHMCAFCLTFHLVLALILLFMTLWFKSLRTTVVAFLHCFLIAFQLTDCTCVNSCSIFTD